jgi:hypothetical protein
MPADIRLARANSDCGREIGRVGLEQRAHIADLTAEHGYDLETAIGIVSKTLD